MPLYRATLPLHAEDAQPWLDALGDDEAVLSVALTSPGDGSDDLAPGPDWQVELLFADPPDADALRARLDALAEACGGRVEAVPRIAPVAEEDWLLRTQRAFPPLTCGRFYLYGSHIEAPTSPPGFLPIVMDAGVAFGSGEHATTQGCLLLLGQHVSRGGGLANVLDLGCGSGLLAIAAGKCGAARVVASDIDAQAVAMCQEYAVRNGVALQAVVSDGFADPLLAASAPYDLIFANILAGPLIALSADIARYLKLRGVVILAGLLVRQVPEVGGAMRAAGLVECDRHVIDNWAILAFTRLA